MTTLRNPCRIVRRADQQGTRPSVSICQAEVEKYATGSDGLSPSSIPSGNKNSKVVSNRNRKSRNNAKTGSKSRNKIRIATINVRTLQEDIKLATAINNTQTLGIDILALQEVRRTSIGMVSFEDDSIKGWQLVWSGHKQKHEHGVRFLIAPHV